MSGFILVTHDAYSHFDGSENIITDIDHFFVSWQAWQLQQMHSQVWVSPLEECRARGLSDHSLISFKISNWPPPKRDLLPIPPWVAKIQRFAAVLRALVGKANLDTRVITVRLRHFQEFLREAARLARNENTKLNGESRSMLLPNLILIARLVHRNDRKLASKLCCEVSFFFARVAVVGSKVTLQRVQV